MAKSKTIQDIRDSIKEKMENEGRTYTWLSEKTGIAYQTLYSSIVKKSFLLNADYIKKINSALGTDFTME